MGIPLLTNERDAAATRFYPRADIATTDADAAAGSTEHSLSAPLSAAPIPRGPDHCPD